MSSVDEYIFGDLCVVSAASLKIAVFEEKTRKGGGKEMRKRKRKKRRNFALC